MAASAVLPAMTGDKALHPFFAKTNGHHDASETTSGDERAEANDALDLEQAKAVKNSRKPRAPTQAPSMTQKTLQEIVNPKSSIPQAYGENETRETLDWTSSDSVGPALRRKRRRTSQTKSVEVGEQKDTLATAERTVDGAQRRQRSPVVVVPASSSLPAVETRVTTIPLETPPKKMLRLNPSGKFSSPITKKPKDEEPEPVRKRGRPRKVKDAKKGKHLLVKVQYANKEDFGPMVGRILCGEERVAVEVPTTTPKKQRTPRKQQPRKATHPFFLGKPKDEPPTPKQESPRKMSAVTPGKLRRQTMTDRSPFKQNVRPAQDNPVGSGLLKDRLMVKHPGAKEPAWPSKEQMHVRGIDLGEVDELPTVLSPPTRDPRKRKTAQRPFPKDESLLMNFSSRLRPEKDAKLRSDGFRDPHPSLRLPQKRMISGKEITQQVACELSMPLSSEAGDELWWPGAAQSLSHPALQRLYDRIPKILSAFDEGRGEKLGWTQKYAPSTTAEVLQPSKETMVLREWLTSLTVTAVEGIPKTESRPVQKPESKPRKKRRRRNDDLDDFLVDSDEDVHDMDELTHPEDVPLISNERKSAKSVVQVASDGVKLSNAVLLSGPHGCGKTAAAYAVAKELGFKVFEISPCERRSGRDVLDKVGDMTENHLVKHHGVETEETSSAEDPSRIDEAFQRDLASGRQGKMNAFFQPQAKAKHNSPRKEQTTKPKANVLEVIQKAIKKPARDQQQSLILLEEVDILFKEDKDFWNTVLKLISTSKRPFIMTCNDEDLVPLQAMPLHAVLRLSPPQLDLATDYLLLIAAAESHLLKREAVMSLYKSKAYDLRAAIAELDLWCQMGVGDPRGGLSWIYQRWPPDSDRDGRGRQLRVVSEGTYQRGMGLSPSPELDEDTKLLWTSREFGLDPEVLLGWNRLTVEENGPLSLKSFSELADSFSASDVYSGLRSSASLDETQAPMTDKARSQYIEGLPLIQSDESIEYSNLTQHLAAASMLSAYRDVGLLRSGTVHCKLEAALLSSRKDFQTNTTLTRHDFTCFDAISTPPETFLSNGPGFLQSTFDGPLAPIATDLAPYVRSIAQYDLALAEQRERVNSLMNDGRNAKRARTTRAARSALEGGQRASTRRERWFCKELAYDAVLATGGEGWPRVTSDVADAGSERDGTEASASSAESAATGGDR